MKIVSSLILLILSINDGSLLLAQQEVNQARDSKIRAYLRSLNASQYQERESGLQGLSSMGLDAVRPIALEVVTGSPESAWRSKQALEAIGIRGDEETFLKTACILKLLFIGANEAMTQRIVELEVQWRLEQKRSVLVHLKSKGARIIESPQQQMGGFNGDLILLNAMQQRSLPEGELRERNRLAATQVSAKRPSVESIREVDEILEGSVEENRGRLFGNLDPNRLTGQESVIDSDILRELQLQRRFGVPLRGQIIGRNQGFAFDGVTIVLDSQWTGNEDDLRRAIPLSDLKRVEIDRVDLPEDELEALAEVPSILSVKFVGNQISSSKFEILAKFQKAFELEIFERELLAGELAALEPMARLTGLTLNRCELSAEVAKELAALKSLTFLTFSGMKIAPEVLESLGAVPSLKALNLDLCKFRIDSFRALEAARRELEIGFTPQALLGVRGPFEPSNARCEISQVVPGSGAAIGGLRAGDVVLKVNGSSVEIFEDLRLHVSQHQAGDTLSLLVERDGKEVELKVQLTAFEEVEN